MPRARPSSALGNNPERNRAHNRQVVLEALRQYGALGRTEMARLADLTAQAVSNIVDELVSDGLLLAHGRRISGRGLPPIQFSLNPNGGYTLGFEMGARHLTSVLVDLSGAKKAEGHLAFEDDSPQTVIPLVQAETLRLKAQWRAKTALLGIGIVMPQPYGNNSFAKRAPDGLNSWSGLDMAATFEKALEATVYLENDATAAAIGERLHGVARTIDHFCLIYFGFGLGMGIMINGQPLRGAHGTAGEIGHIIVEPGGLPCSCGQAGCLEQYASLQCLQSLFSEQGYQPQSLADIDRHYQAKNPIITAWLDETAKRLRLHLLSIETLFDPQTIVLSGILPQPILNDLLSRITPLSSGLNTMPERLIPRLMTGATGHLTAALGAAALPIHHTMTVQGSRR